MEPLFLFIFCGRDFFAEFIFSKRCEKNTGKTKPVLLKKMMKSAKIKA